MFQHQNRFHFVCLFVVALSFIVSSCVTVKWEPSTLPNATSQCYYDTVVKITPSSATMPFFTISYSPGSGNLPAGLKIIQKTPGINEFHIEGLITDAPGVYNFEVKALSKSEADDFNIYTQKFTLNVLDGRWAAFIHLCFDNSLEDWSNLNVFLSRLEGIKSRDTNNNLDIFVLFDKKNSNNYDNGYYKLSGGSFKSDLVKSFTNIDSGDPQVSYNFINWAKPQTNAARYIYILKNHGNGFYSQNSQGTNYTLGIGYDDTFNDSLTIKEYGNVVRYLKAGSKPPIEYLVFADACLMAQVELAYEIRNDANYLVASENNFPMGSYEFLEETLNHPDMSALTLGKNICDSAYNQFNQFNLNMNFTLSLTDLSCIDALNSSINDYSNSVLNYFKNYPKAINLNKSYFIGAGAHALASDDGVLPYMDFGYYMAKVASDYWDQGIKDKAAVALQAYNKSIVYKRNYGYENYTGLTIFHNRESPVFYIDPNWYKQITSFGATNSWSTLLKELEILSFPYLGFENGVLGDVLNPLGWVFDTNTWTSIGSGTVESAIQTVGQDPIDSTLPRVYRGNYSARLNSSSGNCHISTAIYSIPLVLTLFGSPPPLIFYWSAVLSNPGHPYYQQPYFKIEVINRQYNIVYLTRYHYSGDPLWSSWKTIVIGSAQWKIIPWQKETIDLSIFTANPFENEIRITAADCSESGHGGYVYIDADN